MIIQYKIFHYFHLKKTFVHENTHTHAHARTHARTHAHRGLIMKKRVTVVIELRDEVKKARGSIPQTNVVYVRRNEMHSNRGGD